MKAEIERRQSKTEDVLMLFKWRPCEWIDWSEFAKVGGACAWRTRIADARKIVVAQGGRIENQMRREAGRVISEYRYLPYRPLGRSADVEPADQPALFDLGVR